MTALGEGADQPGRGGGASARHAGSQVFDRHLADWRAWQEEPWGRMRYSVAWHVLTRHLPPGDALAVVDVGGGDGREAIGLARLGHRVTIVDLSEGMLALAADAADAAGVGDAITCVVGSADSLRGMADGSADLVLCHFVLGYVADPERVVSELARVLRSGGRCSLIAANPASDVLATAVRELDFERAEALVGATTQRAATFDHDVSAITAGDAEAMCARAGLRVLGRFGGRIAIDLVRDDAVKRDPAAFAALERLEHRLSGLDPYRDIGRFWQVIAELP